MKARRSRRRRQHSSKKNLSLNRLLIRQPKSLAGHPLFELMISHYNTSEKLQKLRMNRQCYRLLDKAVITVENLPNLYRTYKLPRDPFFPLFIRIKMDYLSERERKRAERDKFIIGQVKELPREKRRIIRFLAELEEEISPSGERRLWEKRIYPGSKKRAQELHRISEYEWMNLVDDYLEALCSEYPVFSRRKEQVSASLFLQIIPGLAPLTLPEQNTVTRMYRNLSRRYHPDSGGDSALFIRLQNSRDLLLK